MSIFCQTGFISLNWKSQVYSNIITISKFLISIIHVNCSHSFSHLKTSPSLNNFLISLLFWFNVELLNCTIAYMYNTCNYYLPFMRKYAWWWDRWQKKQKKNNFDSILYWLHLCKWIQCVTISISSQAFVYSSNILPVFYLHSYASFLCFLFFLPTKTRKNSTKFIEWVVSLVWISFPCQHIRLMFYWYSEYCQCPQTMKKIKTNI